MKKILLTIAAMLSLSLLLPTLGCGGKTDDGMTGPEQEKANRLSDIAKKSDGNWNKVPAADKQYIEKEFAGGDEKEAQRVLEGATGKRPGGGGPPGGQPAPK